MKPSALALWMAALIFAAGAHAQGRAKPTAPRGAAAPVSAGQVDEGAPEGEADDEANEGNLNAGPEAAAEVREPEGGEAGQAPDVYVVKPGDTLWDLSQRFLGNPWYWPKVWSYNPEIANPHWIYPGNHVRFYPSAEELPTRVEIAEEEEKAPADNAPINEGGGFEAPKEVPDFAVASMKTPELYNQDDDVVTVSAGRKIGYVPPRTAFIRQDGFVTPRELAEAGTLNKSFAERALLSTFDKVYISFRAGTGVRVGEKYVVFRTIKEVVHPVTGENYGFMTHILGTVRVTAVDSQLATGIIETCIDDIARGDYVGPFGEKFERAVVHKDNTRALGGVVLASLVPRLSNLGEFNVVFIDRGKRDGVEEGNTFDVIRQGDGLQHIFERENVQSMPKERIATLLVVDTKENASAALIIRSIREILVGDRIEMKPAAAQASAK